MASYHRSSTHDRTAHKHSKQGRHPHDKHATEDMARNSSRRSRSGSSHQRTDDPDSDSSDEILIKGRVLRRYRGVDGEELAQQLKGIGKAERGSFRPSSSSSQEIEIHYVPVVTKSSSMPYTSSRQSQSRSSNSSKSGGISASEITSQLKGITKSLLGRRSDGSHRSSRRSRSRSKHEKRDKHGKRRVSSSKFLAPLAQRWICYKCGKLRSDTIQHRHPLKEGQKMQPNWCGKCRVHGELHGRTLVFEGQRHYCWGCGIVRSKKYHTDNPIDKDEMSTPNYCKPCREASPAFDYNLREASEIGSVASVREKAFYYQMRDADLSDVDEEEDDQPPCAPGKENQNPKSQKTLKASKSFILENCSYKVKTISDASSEGAIPLSILKALHLDEERARSTSGGGCRLSDGVYQSPTVESVVNANCKNGPKITAITKEALLNIHGEEDHKLKVSDEPASDVEPGSPTIIPATSHQDNSDGCSKKKVHWTKRDPVAATSHASDSAYCSGYPSDLSYKSAGSRRSRRDPGDVSTGSPPVQEGEGPPTDLGHDIRMRATTQRPGEDVPVQDTTCEPTPHVDVDADTASYRRDSTQSSHSIPPTSPERFVSATTGPIDDTVQGGDESPVTSWVDNPEIPNFSRPYMSPTKRDSEASPSFSRPFLSPPKQRAEVPHDPEAVFSSGFGTRYGYMQGYSPYQSAAHFSDSTQSRDFSGFSAPGEAHHASFQYERYGPNVQHGDWPPAGCPIYDAYSTPAEHNDGGYFGFESDGDDSSFPSSTGYSAFDFSGFGGPSPSNASGGDSFAVESEKFVRKKKDSQGTPRQHSWRLYDDGDDDGSAPNTTACQWRKDGRTTVHRSGGGMGLDELETVRILSIREIDSDEELTISEDNDETSEIGTVAGHIKENSGLVLWPHGL